MSNRYYWLIELVPAFDGHPPFPATYYAGWMETSLNAAMTADPHAAPKWTRKADAEAVAAKLGHTISCVWKAVEHGFDDSTTDQPQAVRDCIERGGSHVPSHHPDDPYRCVLCGADTRPTDKSGAAP